VAVFLAPPSIATTPWSGTTTLRRAETFIGAFVLGGAFVRFNTVGAAFFALGIVEFSCFFGVFLNAAASALASFSRVALSFFLAVSFALFSFSSLFLRAFVALLIFLCNLASSLAALSASFSS
jgi:hypothetical protein